MFLFSLLQVILTEEQEPKAWKGRRPYLLPAIFLLALLISQYATFSAIALAHKTPSGISLFFVDSLLTAIWFGVGVEVLLFRFVRAMAHVPNPANPAKLAGSIKALKALMIAWPILLLFIVPALLENVGLFAYNSSFESTYFAHSQGLWAFAFIFVALFYNPNIVSAIRRVLPHR